MATRSIKVRIISQVTDRTDRDGSLRKDFWGITPESKLARFSTLTQCGGERFPLLCGHKIIANTGSAFRHCLARHQGDYLRLFTVHKIELNRHRITEYALT